MAALKYTANSDQRLVAAHEMLDEAYKRSRFVRMTLVEGAPRSLDQNSMNFELYSAIAEQLYGGDLGHARAECKLDIGFPILVRDDANFSERWSKTLANLDRETQLKFIQSFDLPVTRRMTTAQCSEYISRVMDTYAQAGVVWPDYLVTK